MIVFEDKFCSTCEERQVLAAFPKQSSRSEKRGNVCYSCLRIAQKEREAKKKIAEEARILKNSKAVIPQVKQSWYSALEYAS